MKRAAAIVLLAAGCQRAETESPAAGTEFSQARAAVTSQLRDPESARFGPLTRGRGGAVCGTVNARNGFGGYTGAAPFAWSAATGALLYDFPTSEGHWRDRGELAERFAALGCSIGPDQAKAISALRALETSEK